MKNNIELNTQVLAHISAGKKIAAIKSLRESENIGLKEAKEMIDAYCAENNITPASSESGKLGSFFFSAFCAVAVYGVYVFFIAEQ